MNLRKLSIWITNELWSVISTLPQCDRRKRSEIKSNLIKFLSTLDVMCDVDVVFFCNYDMIYEWNLHDAQLSERYMNLALYNTFHIYHSEPHQTRSRSPSRWFVNCLFSHCVNCLNDPSHVKIIYKLNCVVFLLFPAHSLNLPLWYVQSTAAARQFSIFTEM